MSATVAELVITYDIQIWGYLPFFKFKSLKLLRISGRGSGGPHEKMKSTAVYISALTPKPYTVV
jgi:hypothetical protein